MPSPEQTSHSNDTKTIVTVLLLIFLYPIGVILMWFWTTWPKWVKLIITIPSLLVIGGIIAAGILVTINPQRALQEARDKSTEVQMELEQQPPAPPAIPE